MRTVVPVLAVLGIFGFGQHALAYDFVGVGAWSCAAWLDARKNLRSDELEQWTLGFLSGVGFVGKDGVNPLRDLPPQAVSEWMDHYCQRHPKDTIVRGAELFSVTQ